MGRGGFGGRVLRREFTLSISRVPRLSHPKVLAAGDLAETWRRGNVNLKSVFLANSPFVSPVPSTHSLFVFDTSEIVYVEVERRGIADVLARSDVVHGGVAHILTSLASGPQSGTRVSSSSPPVKCIHCFVFVF